MSRIYDTARWQRVRANQLEREPLCRCCAELGRETPANEVDHIKRLSAGGAPFDAANLQSLCAPHHSHKTNNYDRLGLDWSTHALRGCFADGSPRDPAHPWFTGGPDAPGGVESHQFTARTPARASTAELVSRARH